jgi:hypothetical protein
MPTRAITPTHSDNPRLTSCLAASTGPALAVHDMATSHHIARQDVHADMPSHVTARPCDNSVPAIADTDRSRATSRHTPFATRTTATSQANGYTARSDSPTLTLPSRFMPTCHDRARHVVRLAAP